MDYLIIDLPIFLIQKAQMACTWLGAHVEVIFVSVLCLYLFFKFGNINFITIRRSR